jgi:hypothetical protein
MSKIVNFEAVYRYTHIVSEFATINSDPDQENEEIDENEE